MARTLFKKYLSITSLIIVVSFVFLGTVMVVFISRYWQAEKRELLKQNAKGVASIVSTSVIKEENNEYRLDKTGMAKMQTFVGAFSDNVEADIIVTDVEGAQLLHYYSSDMRPADTPISTSIVKQVLNGQYNEMSTLEGKYPQQCYVVGVPINVTSDKGEVISIGTVFAVSDLSTLAVFREEAIKMFLLAGIAAFMISFGIVWIFSYKLAQPLRKMAAAAHSFGAGDFSVRVEVCSNDEIGHLAQAFNNMAETLSASESMNRNFIANVSHELKTPMTTIAGFIDGILDGTIPKEKENYYLNIVSQEIKRLSRLVKTMLNLSKIDSGELKLRPARFDLSNTIFLALLSFEKNIENKNIEIRGLDKCEPDFVDGDPDMIHQVLYNLLENAVKFTNQDGYIEILIREQADRHVVTIRNSGPGIPADEVGMIFDRFYKTDKSRSQDKNGMGLGLYIVRTIIKLHGGDISVTSVENEYTQFEFWLPNLGDKDGKEKKTVKAKSSVKNAKPGKVEVVQTIEKVEPEIVGEEKASPTAIVDITDQVVDKEEQQEQLPKDS